MSATLSTNAISSIYNHKLLYHLAWECLPLGDLLPGFVPGIFFLYYFTIFNWGVLFADAPWKDVGVRSVKWITFFFNHSFSYAHGSWFSHTPWPMGLCVRGFVEQGAGNASIATHLNLQWAIRRRRCPTALFMRTRFLFC